MGWLLGGFVFPGLALVGAGIGAGLFQWFVLQGRIHRSYRWVLATTSGWVAGYLLSIAAIPAGLAGLNGVALGLAAGIAQWLVLRDEAHWSGWWIPFSLMGWITGLALMPGFLSTPSLAGAITGIVLIVLLQTPKQRTDGHKKPGTDDSYWPGRRGKI